MVIQIEEIENASVQIIKDGLAQIVNDDINNIEIEGVETTGNKVVSLATYILTQSEFVTFQNLSKTFAKSLYYMLRKGNILNESFLQSFWREFHIFTLNSENHDIWNAVVNTDTQEFTFMYHSLGMIVASKIISLEKLKRPCQEIMEPEERLPERQQEVLRYVSGFVIYSLQKHYKRLKESKVPSTRAASRAALDFLTSLDTRFEKDIEARSYLEFTQKWIKIRNQGGLVTVNDNTFILCDA